MKTIAAVVPQRSYAPELYALQAYLAETPDMRVKLITPENAGDNAFDAVYLKMGFAPKWRPSSAVEIHDYSSASTGKLRRTKDVVKSTLSRRPVLRSFLTKTVRDQFHFRDDVPSVLRDMGVPDRFLQAGMNRQRGEEFDLFYAGSISQARRSSELFGAVEQAGLTILAAGHVQRGIAEQFSDSPNVTFAGPVTVDDIPELAARCRFGVNLTPNVSPYNFQTSTKVVEYLALGLPVISNDYRWIREFEAESGARIVKLSDIADLEQGTLEADHFVPDMSSYSWRSIFETAQIYAALRAAL